MKTVFRATVLALLALAPAARAALGKSRSSIEADHRALGGASLVVTPGARYEIHESRMADGGVIRQYVNGQGTVFAVTWSARFRPNLQQLLGTHYDAYLSASRARGGGHHVFSVTTPGLVLGIAQRPRGSAGAAHVPALLPPGVQPAELR